MDNSRLRFGTSEIRAYSLLGTAWVFALFSTRFMRAALFLDRRSRRSWPIAALAQRLIQWFWMRSSRFGVRSHRDRSFVIFSRFLLAATCWRAKVKSTSIAIGR